MVYANPGSEGAVVQFKPQYENYIGGQWVAPVDGTYFDNVSPVNGEAFCKIPRSTEADINLALDAAHSAKDAWGATPATERSNVLLKICLLYTSDAADE